MNIPPGKELTKPDLSRPHYRYTWLAQYDAVGSGPWVPQFDDEGYERSAGWLDQKRLVRILLQPANGSSERPTIDLRVNPSKGELGVKFWRVWQTVGAPSYERVNQILQLVTSGPTAVSCSYDWDLNWIIIGSDA